MKINEIVRPWIKKSQTRYNPSGFYQSREWKDIRTAFRRESTKMPDGTILPNIYCVDCYKEHKMRLPGKNTDHIIAKKLGGTEAFSNLQTQCDTHHAQKSANEGKI